MKDILKMIAADKLHPNPDNPRRSYFTHFGKHLKGQMKIGTRLQKSIIYLTALYTTLSATRIYHPKP